MYHKGEIVRCTEHPKGTGVIEEDKWAYLGLYSVILHVNVRTKNWPAAMLYGESALERITP